MRRPALSDFKTALALESLRAVARLRKTGEAPTDETAPRLMAIWRGARNKLTGVGMDCAVSVYTFKGLRFQVSSIYGRDGRLHRFYLRDYFSDALVLTGDDDGPVFLPQSHDSIGDPVPRNQAVSIGMGSTHTHGKESCNA